MQSSEVNDTDLLSDKLAFEEFFVQLKHDMIMVKIGVKKS